jgi:hypothetical protein
MADGGCGLSWLRASRAPRCHAGRDTPGTACRRQQSIKRRAREPLGARITLDSIHVGVGEEHAVKLSREEIDIETSPKMSCLHSKTGRARQDPEPASLRLYIRFARATRSIVEFGPELDEWASPREVPVVRPHQPALEERAYARQAALRLERGPDDDRHELVYRGFDHGEVEVFLGAEVGEESALRHIHLIRQLADGDSLEAAHGRHAERTVDDPLAGLGSFAHLAINTTDRAIMQ